MHGDRTFPKRERLQYGWQFRQSYERGRKVPGRFAVLFALETPAQPRALGVVTGRKLGNAVARNRARRLLREVYRLHKTKLKQNVQLVIIARAAINGKPYREVETAMLDLFQAAGVMVM